MRPWPLIVNGLVLAFASFFVFIGVAFLLNPFLPLPGLYDRPVEGGWSVDKTIVGVVFLLAAAPMFYYVFAPSAKGLPPAPKRPRDEKKSPPEGL